MWYLYLNTERLKCLSVLKLLVLSTITVRGILFNSGGRDIDMQTCALQFEYQTEQDTFCLLTQSKAPALLNSVNFHMKSALWARAVAGGLIHSLLLLSCEASQMASFSTHGANLLHSGTELSTQGLKHSLCYRMSSYLPWAFLNNPNSLHLSPLSPQYDHRAWLEIQTWFLLTTGEDRICSDSGLRTGINCLQGKSGHEALQCSCFLWDLIPRCTVEVTFNSSMGKIQRQQS